MGRKESLPYRKGEILRHVKHVHRRKRGEVENKWHRVLTHLKKKRTERPRKAKGEAV